MMSFDLKEMVSVNQSYEELKLLGIEYQKKTVESILAFAKIVYTLKEKCDNDKDQDFNLLAEQFWGLSSSGASQFAKTGKHAERLVGYAQRLPASARSLYELTQLNLQDLDKHINLGDITPNSTVNDVQALKTSLKETKSKKKAKDNDENPFAVEAEDEQGNPVDAELVDETSDRQKDKEVSEEPKGNKKMSIIEALTIFDIDMNMLYMSKLQEGTTDKALLDKAFMVITGEKL